MQIIDLPTRKIYADLLNAGQTVHVPHLNGFVSIWWSDVSTGWYLTVFDDINSNDIYTEQDGGFCTGTALDAVGFFLGES
jgi:hypothetical protein